MLSHLFSLSPRTIIISNHMLRTLVSRFSTIKQFTQLDHLNHHLASNKYPYLIVYFTAKWNPHCKLTDEHISELATSFSQIEIIKVNSDVAPKIAKHYLVKAEPEFVFCLNGDEVIRQTGPNKDGLVDKCKALLQMAQKVDISQNKWTPFGVKFEAFYKNAFKAK